MLQQDFGWQPAADGPGQEVWKVVVTVRPGRFSVTL